MIAISDLDLRSDTEGKTPVSATFKAGEFKWLPGNYTHTLTNVSSHPARLITVEF